MYPITPSLHDHNQFASLQGQLRTLDGRHFALDNQIRHIGSHTSQLNGHVSQINEALNTLTVQAQETPTREELLQMNDNINVLTQELPAIKARLAHVENNIGISESIRERLAAMESAVAELKRNAKPNVLEYAKTAPITYPWTPVPDPWIPVSRSERRRNFNNTSLSGPSPSPFGDGPEMRYTLSTPSRPGAQSTPTRSGRQSGGSTMMASPNPHTGASFSAEPAKFPRASTTAVLTGLFNTVEIWAKTYLYLPVSSLAHPESASEPLIREADQAIGRINGSRDLFESPIRHLFIAGIMNRILVRVVMDCNIFANWEDPIAVKYTQLLAKAQQYKQDNAMNTNGRGDKARELARVAGEVMHQPGFWDYITFQIDHHVINVLVLFGLVIPDKIIRPTGQALRSFFENAFRIRTRLMQENLEYDMRFLKYGDRYDMPGMIVRDPVPVDRVSSHTHMVRFCIAPTVLEKSFDGSLRMETVHRPQVALALKRGERNAIAHRNRHGRSGGPPPRIGYSNP